MKLLLATIRAFGSCTADSQYGRSVRLFAFPPSQRMTVCVVRCVVVTIAVWANGAAMHSMGAQAPPPARTDTVVRQAGAPLHPGVGSIVQELSIGRDDGPDEYLFGSIGELAVDASGAIYVYDSSVPILRVFDRMGQYVRTIGRRGQGPGEYLGKLGMTVLPDGRLLFWDGANWRVNVYGADGRPVTQWLTPSGTSGTSNSSSSRALIAEVSGLVTRRVQSLRIAAGASPTVRTVWIRSRADGSMPDTLVEPWLPPRPPMLEAVSPAGTGRQSTPVPFTAPSLIAYSPLGYFVTAVPSRYAFELHLPGQPVLSIRRTVPAAAVSAADRDRERARVIESLRRIDPGWTWRGPDIPSTQPFFTDLRVAADGRIWTMVARDPLPPGVQPGGGSGSSRGGGRPSGPPPGAGCARITASLWDIFEPSGVYVGRVAIPARVGMWVMRGDTLWATACTDDDAERVRRYRIVWQQR